jgi:hypothetical protein
MAAIGISITKSTSFRNSVQEFSNVYFYAGGSTPTGTQADSLIDELTAMEKTFHSTFVTFVRGRLWTNTGSQSTSNMISQKNLTGTGARGTVSGFDKERAYLFRLRAGVDSRGQPVYLRKWFHACGLFYTAQTTPNTTIMDNTAGFDSTQRAGLVSQMNGIGSLTSAAGPWTLTAKSGRQPTAGEVWQAHQFLEHHQLGDQWRAQ